jgi:formate/nitrite transporter
MHEWKNMTLNPREILNLNLNGVEAKAKASLVSLMTLGFLAGAFIAFAAQGSNMAGFNLVADPATYGIGRLVIGAVFAVGLMLVVLAGGELFTGNALMLGGVVARRISLGSMLRNWVVVYAFNLLGSVFVAFLISKSGQFSGGADLLGIMTVKIAAGKTALTFSKALILGIFCNWLVCLAVWIASGTDNMAGKIWGIFFPICLFVTSGFEHSVANMYYIPAGIFAAADPAFAEGALALGVSQSALDSLTWAGFFVNNLLPVTIGNIIGGGIFVALAYLLAFGIPKKPETCDKQ